jgi:hypothetical protein
VGTKTGFLPVAKVTTMVIAMVQNQMKFIKLRAAMMSGCLPVHLQSVDNFF